MATFSHHFGIMQLILQPLITNGIIAMLKMKSALCGVTPCNDIYEMYQFCMFNWSFALIDIGKMFSILIKSLVQGCIGDVHEKKYIELWSSTFLESINFQVWFTINTRYSFSFLSYLKMFLCNFLSFENLFFSKKVLIKNYSIRKRFCFDISQSCN